MCPGTPPTNPVVVCQTTIRRMRALGLTSVEPLLAGCPMFERALLWEATPGELVPYSGWTVVQQGRLDDLFSWLMQGVPDLGLTWPDVHEAMATVTPMVYLRESEAFGIYAAHVAHVLYLEVTGRVPWSIVTVPDQELQVLLASPSYFVRAVGPLYATARTMNPLHVFTLPDPRPHRRRYDLRSAGRLPLPHGLLVRERRQSAARDGDRHARAAVALAGA